MRPLNRTALSAIVLCGALLATVSCKKQITGPLNPTGQQTSSQSLTATASNCRPAIFATMHRDTWTTIAQKWYSDGKVRYFKGNFSSPNADFMYNILQDIEWGEVTYEGNQVQLRDGSNKVVFRATLDEFNKPVATYMHTQTTTGGLYIDTSYYYYTGERLDSIISLRPNGWDKLTFTYGGNGNLASFYSRNGQFTTEFRYSSTPANGMVAPYLITPAYRMLDLLELIKVPMHNTVSQVFSWLIHFPTGYYVFYQRDYYVYSLNSDGLVQSYLTPYGLPPIYYYTGWDCGGASSAAPAQRPNNIVTSFDQFKQWGSDKKGN